MREEEGSGTLGALGLPAAAAAEAGGGEEVGASVLEGEAEGWVAEARLDAICQLGSPTGDAAAAAADDDEGME